MIIVAIVQEKGGTGKTTTAVNFAAGFARILGPDKVLIVDTDPQASTTLWLAGEASEARHPDEPSIYDIYTKERPIEETIYTVDLEGAGKQCPASRLHMIPAVGALRDLDPVINTGLTNLFNLKKAMRSLQDHYQLVLIDCPGILSAFTMSALLACTHVLIPFPPGRLEAEQVARLITHLRAIQQDHNPHMEISGILPIRTTRTSISKNGVAEMTAAFGEGLMLPQIDERVALQETTMAGVDIFLYASHNKHALPSSEQFDEALRRFGASLGLMRRK